MKLRIITITQKCPAWVQEGYAEYAKRLPLQCALELVEIPAEKRTANADIKRITEKEGEKMLAAINSRHHIIALDVKGNAWSTEQLAEHMQEWLQSGKNIDLLVGGPEGLAPDCLAKAHEKWSLSALTFPHIIVRLIVAEQIYRAHSILQGHPYHR